MQAGALVHDDEGMLELSRALGVQAEVGLQGDGQVNALGHIHEGAAGPHRAVQRRELMVVGRYQLHEVLAHHVGVFALQGALHVGIHHALGGHGVLHVVIYQLGVVLRAHAGQRFPLGLRDAQPLEGLLDVLRHVLPVIAHFGVGADIGGDVIHVQSLNGGTPVGELHLVIDLKGFQPELLHPRRIVLLLGELFHDLRRQAGFHPVGIMLLVTDVVDAAVYILYIGLFFEICHIRSLPVQSSFRLPKPFSLISSTSSAPPFRTMTPSSITWAASTWRASRIRVEWVMISSEP